MKLQIIVAILLGTIFILLGVIIGQHLSQKETSTTNPKNSPYQERTRTHNQESQINSRVFQNNNSTDEKNNTEPLIETENWMSKSVNSKKASAYTAYLKLIPGALFVIEKCMTPDFTSIFKLPESEVGPALFVQCKWIMEGHFLKISDKQIFAELKNRKEVIFKYSISKDKEQLTIESDFFSDTLIPGDANELRKRMEGLESYKKNLANFEKKYHAKLRKKQLELEKNLPHRERRPEERRPE